MKTYYLIIFYITFGTQLLFGQTPSLGLNHHHQKWRQIHTDTVQIIFPVGLEKAAQRLSHLIHKQTKTETSIGLRIKKFPIILHPHTTTPNGFVAMAPVRSEYYMTPPQLNFGGATAWTDLLSIHEYRHIQQTANSKVGVTKLFGHIFGEYGWAIMRGMAIPRWHLEGDAVLTETLYTNAGRGRQPSFEMGYKALSLHSKKYNYEKASAGSFRDFVPNYYQMGYYMTTYGRKNFGKNLWIKVLDDASRYKKLFHPFSRSLKKQTSLNTKALYKKTFRDLDSIWRIEDQELKLTTSSPITKKHVKSYTEYRNPVFWKNDKIICEKSSFDHIRKFIVVDQNGNENILFKAGRSAYHNRSLSVHQNKMIWAEDRYHKRWTNVQYSVLMIYDLEKKQKTQLTKKTRYFAPAFSKDGTQIVVVHVSENQTYHLHILDANSGDIIREISNPTHEFYTFPTWDKEGNIIVTMRSSRGNRLVKINPKTDVTQDLVKLTDFQISNPKVSEDYIFFTGAFTKISNIFAVKRNNPDSLFQVTSVRFGAFQPTISKKNSHLIFTEFSHLGYALKRIDIKPLQWKRFERTDYKKPDYFKPLLKRKNQVLSSHLENVPYPTSKFPKSHKLLNLHSLGYIVRHPNYGAQLSMQNFFSTMYGTLGGSYNVNEKQYTYYADLHYGEWFPVWNIGASHGHRFSYVVYPNADAPKPHVWQETSGYLGLRVPLNLSSGASRSTLDMGIKYKLLHLNYHDDIFNLTRGGLLNTAGFDLIFNRIEAQALRNFYPKWGIHLYTQGRTTLAERFNSGNRIYVEGGFYLPSIFPNHGFHFSAGYRKEAVIGAYRFQDNFIFSRGYQPYFSNKIYRLSGNYGLPLLRPDIALGGLLFLKQIKANLFYDYSKYHALFKPHLQRSWGAEIRFDIRFLRLLDLDMGFRYSQLLDPNPILDQSKHQIQFIFFQLSA